MYKGILLSAGVLWPVPLSLLGVFDGAGWCHAGITKYCARSEAIPSKKGRFV
jgi:hypothetical protein